MQPYRLPWLDTGIVYRINNVPRYYILLPLKYQAGKHDRTKIVQRARVTLNYHMLGTPTPVRTYIRCSAEKTLRIVLLPNLFIIYICALFFPTQLN